MIYAEARAKGDEKADEAKAAGKSVEEQVSAAAEGAMETMKDENAKISDEVSAAYKSAFETGLEEGLTGPAAQTQAVDSIKDALAKGGMSSSEAGRADSNALQFSTFRVAVFCGAGSRGFSQCCHWRRGCSYSW